MMVKLANHYILLAESPFQLINCVEALDHFNLYDFDTLIIVLDKNTRTNSAQLKQVISYYPRAQEYVEYVAVGNNILSKNTLIPKLYRKCRRKCDTIFLGDFRSPIQRYFARIAKSDRLVLLDDGAGTLNFRDRDFLKTFNAYEGIYWKIIFFLTKSNFKNFHSITLFTIFSKTLFPNLKNVEHEQNEMKMIRNRFVSKSKHSNKGIYFIGSKLDEVGIVTTTQYLGYLRYIYESNPSDELIYIPHRGERLDKVESIRKMGWEIINIESCVEIHFAQLDCLPLKIISFYSTALFTLRSLFIGYNVKIISYRLLSSEIKLHKESIENIYEVLGKTDITILNLESSQ